MILWSHNAYWFQGAPSLWGEELQVFHPEALAALTGLYTSLQPDVLLLQEVPGPDVPAALSESLNMRTHFVFLASAFPPPGCGQNLTRSVHGDFAHALGQHTRVAWMPSESRVYDHMVQAGFHEPHPEKTGVRRIDYVWIDPSQLRAEALATPENFDIPDHTGTKLSDHLPVGVRLSLAEQDR